jgi:uncharacterized protein YoxC
LDTLLAISQIIFFLSISVLCIYLINYVGKIVISISNLEKSINELKQKLDPVLDSFNMLAEKSNKIVDSVNDQVNMLQNTFKNFKQVSDDVLDFERNIKTAIEKPVLDFINLIMGLLSGLNFFKKKTDE